MSDLISLQALINTASITPSKEVIKITSRAGYNRRGGPFKVILIDLSGSMQEIALGQRKVDLMWQALERVTCIETIDQLLGFNDNLFEVNLDNVPEPQGSTELAPALSSILQEYRPTSTLVVSDGVPNNRDAALSVAGRFQGVINTLYIGPEDNQAAIAFMRSLATSGAGTASRANIENGVAALSSSMLLLLEGS